MDVALVDTPDFPEALEVWRVWRIVLRREGHRLGSVVHSTTWPAGEPLVASCARHPLVPGFLRRSRRSHAAPDPRCECGIYGTSLARLTPYLADEPFGGTVARALGRVSLWGSVVECERGLRASHAYPRHLYLPLDSGRRAEDHVRRILDDLAGYGVPVERVPARCADVPRLLERERQRLGSGCFD